MADEDYFSDVHHLKSALGGIFDESDGMKRLGEARTRFRQDKGGIAVDFQCQHCGLPGAITVDWDELTYIMLKLEPPGWFKDPKAGVMRPRLGCRGCNVLIEVGLNPQECQRSIVGGVEAGYITEAQVQRATQHIANKARTPRV